MKTNFSRWLRRYFTGWNLLSPLVVGFILIIIDLSWGTPEGAIFAIPYCFAIWIVVDLLAWIVSFPVYAAGNRRLAGHGFPPATHPGYLSYIKA